MRVEVGRARRRYPYVARGNNLGTVILVYAERMAVVLAGAGSYTVGKQIAVDENMVTPVPSVTLTND